MASLNTAARELVLKIVYYGPGLGGKTSSLQALHDSAPPERRGKLVSLATPVDRTLYFDFLPLRLPPMRGLSVRLQLFTVPGQVYFNATRRLVLSGADGIVFVADSQPDRMDANIESLENLRENLAEHGRDLAVMPHVFAWNKRDLDEVVTLDELDQALNRHRAPAFGTVATRGTGVDETLEKITKLVSTAYEAQIPAAPASLMHAPAMITLAHPSVTVRGENGEEEVITSATKEPAPISRREAEEVVTSSTLMTPSEGTFLADLDRLEKKASSPPPQEGDDDLESVAGSDWDRELSAETRIPPRPLSTMNEEPRAHGLTFAPLFAPNERALIEQIEASIAHGAYADALGMCEAALSRLLSSITPMVQGDGSNGSPVHEATLSHLIGLDGRRYLAFRAMARRARQIGDVGARDVLESFAFLLEAKVASAQWDALRVAMGASSAIPPPPRPGTTPAPAMPPLPRGSIPPT